MLHTGLVKRLERLILVTRNFALQNCLRVQLEQLNNILKEQFTHKSIQEN